MPPTYGVDELDIPPYRHRHPSADVAPPSASKSRHRPPNTIHLDHKPETRLGQYNIIKTVGEGSFGKVKLAVHESTGQQVALKMISRKNLTSRDMQGRVEREIAYLQLLRHPHIIKLYSVITTPTEIIMVIEYAGGELFDFLVNNGKVPEDAARRFFQQIICAVEYCHRHKIVHRDLKPENLLLDSNLNVKIADFGLSNIMTDGNFLKTSCGSPNYAAPEVIGGKLYAGPEVDVWSCGVILFVLLCGKLPFDDDYIPNLFKKISQGKYSIPGYVAPGAKDLIQKMLIVNPLQRITIAEIRKHEWFKKDLPHYLQPPREEFFDTGVDVTNLPPLQQIERGPTETLRGPLHDAVVGKLGSTMGYAKDDVQDALTREEPSAIKDAYMIVRENQMMIPRLSSAKNEGFVAQSPPFEAVVPGSPFKHPGSPLAGGHRPPSRTASPFALNPQKGDGLGITSEAEDLNTGPMLSHSPASTISILPTSMPGYHQAFMAGDPKPSTSPPAAFGPYGKSTLKPSNPRMQAGRGVDLFTPVSQTNQTPHHRRQRQTKWQFGIRSRNSPLEAVGCIYRALKKLGAEWGEAEYNSEEDGPGSSPASPDTSDRDDEIDRRYDSSSSSEDDEPRRRKKEKARMPSDPWVIQCRWKKLAPKATSPPVTPRSSMYYEEGKAADERGDSVYVHMTIQLYQLEHNNYLVDFKCTGYERIPPKEAPKEEVKSYGPDEQTPKPERKKVGFEATLGGDDEGKAIRDGPEKGKQPKEDLKEVMSPFPFLDLAGRLIVALAEAT